MHPLISYDESCMCFQWVNEPTNLEAALISLPRDKGFTLFLWIPVASPWFDAGQISRGILFVQ